ncbi:MAG: YveK family protein [Solirubrobacterales bacterium]
MGESLAADIRKFYYVIKARIILIISITLLCAIASGVLSFYVLKPVYQAQISVIVGKPQSTDKSQQYTDVIMYQNLVKTYTEIAKSRIVAESAVQKLDFSITADDIQSAVTISSKEGTQILYIKAESIDASHAVQIVNAITSAFIDQSKRVYPTGGDIQVMDTAQYPKAPVKPRKSVNIAIAVLLGLILSTTLAFVLEYIDRTIKDEEDVEKYLGLPVVGIIPKE